LKELTLYQLLEQIEQKLYIKKEDVLNVYLVGSRLNGTYTEESDWDFMLVVANYCGEVKRELPVIDLMLYNPNAFEIGLQEHILTILTW